MWEKKKMSQNDFMNFFSPEIAKNMAGINGFHFGMQDFMEVHRRNFEALTEAQQRAMEGIQAAAQRQTELFSEMFENNTALANEILGEGSPEQKVARQADMMKKVYEKAIVNIREIGEMLNKSNRQATDILHKRVGATLSELKSAMEKPGKSSSKKAA